MVRHRNQWSTNNSGLIKFLDSNRDSYEERVSFAYHQNANYVNRIAPFLVRPVDRPESAFAKRFQCLRYFILDIFNIYYIIINIHKSFFCDNRAKYLISRLK